MLTVDDLFGDSMPSLLTRLAAVAILASAVFQPAFAEPAAVPIPPALAPMFKQLNLQSVASLAYEDEDGKPLDEATFLERFKGKGFKMKKKAGKEGLPEVTLVVMSKVESDGKFSKLKAGDAFPEFHLTRLDGTAIDNKAFAGRYTLVSFYFAGCGPCVAEVPVLNALAQSRKDINLLAVTFDDAKVSKEFVAQHSLAWPIVPGAGKLTKDIGVRGYPTLALINPQGKLVDVTSSVRDLPALNEWLDQRTSDKVITQGQAVPASIRELLKYHQEEKFSSLFFYDENGRLMDANAFAEQIKAGKKYSAGKKITGDADPQLVFTIMSKEAIAAATTPPSKIKPGQAFPEFHLARLDGSAIDNKALNGRYTLVSFYFAGCSPCVKEVPTLNALAEKRKDINLLAVTFDSRDESKRFVDEHHLSWTIVPDAKKLTEDAGVQGYPLFALLDPAGKLIEMAYPGVITKVGGTIEAWLDKKIAAAN
jgi:peroxiredoxin